MFTFSYCLVSAHNRSVFLPPFMRHFILSRWPSPFCPFRQATMALLAGALVGLPLCSATAQENFKQPDYSKFPAESGPITLEVWSWVGGLDKAAKLFEQAYPDIKVHVNNVGGGPGEYQKLQTALKAGSGGPDVAQIEYMFLPSFIVTDGLADLSKYGAADLKDFFVPWTWGQVSPDGKAVYGIPQDTGPMALLYNKKVFDQYGLTVPATWDEFTQQAEKLAQASAGKVKFCNFFPTHAPWFISLAWANGAELFKTQGDSWVQSLNQPACEKVLTYWDGLIKKKLVSTIPGFTAEFYSAIGSGQIASSIEAAWGPGVLAASLNDKTSGDWQVAPLPQWAKDQSFHSGNWGGSCNVVPKQSKHLKAAVLFSVWLNSAKGPVMSNWNNYGIFPAALAGLASPDLNQPDKNPSKFCGGQNVADVYSQASKAVNADFAWSPWFAFVNDNYNKQIEALLGGKATPKQALDAWQNESLKNAKGDGYEVIAK
ncbi:MAG: multiple sugar transport system substrate-binding protein [Verrucomicrobiota bacterium]|jgi:multiple sugar transport system substrate-binding protein|nr:multiple sugar transport system substrate-binding protein [Verrucomicrobiota bacterium]